MNIKLWFPGVFPVHLAEILLSGDHGALEHIRQFTPSEQPSHSFSSAVRIIRIKRGRSSSWDISWKLIDPCRLDVASTQQCFCSSCSTLCTKHGCVNTCTFFPQVDASCILLLHLCPGEWSNIGLYTTKRWLWLGHDFDGNRCTQRQQGKLT